ncbi:MAG: DUF4062 domain-containing protein [Bacteroidetes bacterium]|nr:DUF4062 domain-containing protein [Bacteroidota bacterium]
MRKVYLSSTFNDLKEYRSGVIDLFRLLNDTYPLMSMEAYTASEKSTVQRCVDDAAGCDIYILLLGNRYGWIPNDPGVNPNNRSITELEFEAALRSKMAGKTTILSFSVDPSQTDVFPLDAETDGVWTRAQKQEKLNTFRDRANAVAQPSSPFATIKGLSDRVSAAMIAWLNGQLPAKEKKLDERLKYCFDRVPQYASYEQWKIDSSLPRFQVFVSNGVPEDLGENFINRCAIFSLFIREEDVFTCAFNEFFDEEGDSLRSRDSFLRQLREFETKKGDTLEYTVIKFSCHESHLVKEKIETLAAIFAALNAGDGHPIRFFLHVVDDHQDIERGDPPGIQSIKAHFGSTPPWLVFLSRFKMAEKSELESWIRKYVTADEGEKEDLLDEHFAGLQGRFRMKPAERQIRQFYQYIKKQQV